MGRTWLAAAAFTLLFASSIVATSPAAPVAGRLALDPDHIGINLFFGGATVEVRAEVPAGYEAAVRLTSRPERLEMKRLGKKAGLLWMTVGSVTFERVPAVYQVLTSVPLTALAPAPVLAECGLGYESLVPDRVPESSMRAELVGLKEHEGLFALHEEALKQGPPNGQQPPPVLADENYPAAAAAGDARLLRGTFRLPASAPTGDYFVDLIGFREQRSIRLAGAALRLDYAGGARTWRSLAMDHGLAYGVFACFIAIVIGLLTGILFRPKSGESH